MENKDNEFYKEIYFVQNQAIGASCLWRFTVGYNFEGKFVPFPLLFLVLPCIFRENICNYILSTNTKSGLTKISEKLFTEHNNDLIYSIQNSVLQFKNLTLNSIQIAFAKNLLFIDEKSAEVIPCTSIKLTKLSESTSNLLKASERFGKMCSSLTLYEISNLFKVRF